MNGSPPKVTVILPTRERCDALESSLRTVTGQTYENLEIIVSDNYSRDRTEAVVRSMGDSRVRYANTGRRLSMSRNWEFALSHVTSGWVTIIGDDDGLLPGSIERVAGMISSAPPDIQAIRSDVCLYAWPSLTNRKFGRLGVPLGSGQEIRSSAEWLTKVMHARATYSDLPMLYNGGYVHMAVLNRIKAATGAFYLSAIPDVYSAVAIASVADRYLYVHEPLAINGISRHSTGMSQFAAGNGGGAEISPARLFQSEGNIAWHADVPLSADGSYPSSFQAMVYESYLQSIALRYEAPPGRDRHAEQLELILATAGRHETSIEEWARRFAAGHGLNFDAIHAKAQRRKVWLRGQAAWRWASRVINTYSVGSPDLPIENVYEASLVAARIRTDKPSRLANMRRLAGRALERVTP
jgi:glycosyltransferase involved in cell wall biosynthesis